MTSRDIRQVFYLLVTDSWKDEGPEAIYHNGRWIYARPPGWIEVKAR